MRKKNILLIILISYFLNGITQPGTINQQFAANGKFMNTFFRSSCTAIETQQDGKILIGGYYDAEKATDRRIVICRLNTNGTFDETFGIDGVFSLNNVNGSYANSIKSIAVQSNGKIIACGSFGKNYYPYSDIGILRLYPDGWLDSSFAENGVRIVSMGDNDEIGEMKIGTNDKIVITGLKEMQTIQVNGNLPLFYAFLKTAFLIMILERKEK